MSILFGPRRYESAPDRTMGVNGGAPGFYGADRGGEFDAYAGRLRKPRAVKREEEKKEVVPQTPVVPQSGVGGDAMADAEDTANKGRASTILTSAAGIMGGASLRPRYGLLR